MSVTAPATAPGGRDGVATSAGVRVRATRSQRLPWLALAVALVVSGGLLAGLLVQSVGDRLSVLAADRAIAAGQVITAGDLRVVDVGVDGQAALVPARARASVIGQVAVMGIPEGALLAPGQLAADGGVPSGSVVAGALLALGEVPVPGLRAGDRVALVAVSAGQAESSETIGEADVFSAVPAGETGSSVFVSLVVDASLGERVADVVAQQRLRLVLLPPVAGGSG